MAGVGVAGELKMRGQHAQRRVHLGACGHRYLPALADQLGHPQLGGGDAQQARPLWAVAQQQHTRPAQVGNAPTAVVEVVLVVEQVIVVVQFGSRQRGIVRPDRIDHPKLQKLAA